MSEPLRPNCDLCGKPLGKDDWIKWRVGFATADRVAHSSCFEEMYGKEDGQSSNGAAEKAE